jgi:hypothetical protein
MAKSTEAVPDEAVKTTLAINTSVPTGKLTLAVVPNPFQVYTFKPVPPPWSSIEVKDCPAMGVLICGAGCGLTEDATATHNVKLLAPNTPEIAAVPVFFA